MGSLTIKDIKHPLEERLRARAASNGRSVEEEAHLILQEALSDEETPAVGLGEAIRRRFADLGGVELDLPPREPMRDPPTFD